MRAINLIVCHCSDSDEKSHDNIETIRQWHTARGFTGPDGVEGTHDDVGYHFFIDKAGTVHPGRDESAVGAHAKGFNARSLGICLSGRREFTEEQFKALEKLCFELSQKYGLSKADIVGHGELDAFKTCPNFDVQKLIAGWPWH
jgi:N-acetylmuramoyl-L-alanine amidase